MDLSGTTESASFPLIRKGACWRPRSPTTAATFGAASTEAFSTRWADTAAGAFARIRYGRRNVTLNGSMNYLRPTTHSKTLTAVGREIKVGGHVGFFEVNITDDTGALVACAQMNMYFLD